MNFFCFVQELIEVFNIREAMIPHKEALNRFDKRKSAVAASSLSQASQSSQRTQQRQNLSAIEEKSAVSLDDQEQSDEEEVLPASKKRKRTGRR